MDQQTMKQILGTFGEAIVNSDFAQRHKPKGLSKGAFPIERELAYRYAADALDALQKAGYKIVKDSAPVSSA